MSSLVINGSLQIPANAGLGLVLTSDAQGNCSWQSLSPVPAPLPPVAVPANAVSHPVHYVHGQRV